MQSKIKLGISACLLGKKVRYDGSHKYDEHIKSIFGKSVDFMALCPESECGMSVPREPMHLEKNGSVRLVTIKSKIDHTNQICAWIKKRVAQLEKEKLCGFILKAKSPSCGIEVRLFDINNTVVDKTRGLFAKAVMENFPNLPVEDEVSLADSRICEDFLKKAKACAQQMAE